MLKNYTKMCFSIKREARKYWQMNLFGIAQVTCFIGVVFLKLIKYKQSMPDLSYSDKHPPIME